MPSRRYLCQKCWYFRILSNICDNCVHIFIFYCKLVSILYGFLPYYLSAVSIIRQVFFSVLTNLASIIQDKSGKSKKDTKFNGKKKQQKNPKKTLRTEGDFRCSGQVISSCKNCLFFGPLLDNHFAWFYGSNKRQYIIVEGEYKN